MIAFGAFDPLHEGHQDFLRQAKALGDQLTVVVARDSAIRAIKGYEPFQPEEQRLAAVALLPTVDVARFGNETVHHYEIFDEVTFDVVALGYDQAPTDDEVRAALDIRGLQRVRIVRLAPFHPEKYKSTFIRRGQ